VCFTPNTVLQTERLVVSVLDDLRTLEQRVTERLAELEPLVQEYNELRTQAERFNLALTANGAQPTRRARPAKTRRARAGKTRAAGRASRRHNVASPTSSQPQSERRGTEPSPTPPKPAAEPRQAAQPRAQRREQVLELVKGNPGITVAEVGERLGVDSTSLYRHVNRLTADGQIRKTGRELQPS